MRFMRLSRRSEPFDSEHFIYELKIDGFRSLDFSRRHAARVDRTSWIEITRYKEWNAFRSRPRPPLVVLVAIRYRFAFVGDRPTDG